MAGEGRPLPVAPRPCPDERLSSWLARLADLYQVSLEELQEHVGWARPAAALDFEPSGADLARIAQATAMPIDRLLDMTFATAPPRVRALARRGDQNVCLACGALERPPARLRAWAFAFAFWCPQHGQPLVGSERNGARVLGDEAAARRGAALIGAWAEGRDTGPLGVAAAFSLLLSPCREPTPPAPWELARLSRAERESRPEVLSRACRRPGLAVVVPEFAAAAPVSDWRAPEDPLDLRDAAFAERYAAAIGIARVLRDPVTAAARVLAAADAFGRRAVLRATASWPISLRLAVAQSAGGRRSAPGRRERKCETARQAERKW